MSGMVSYQAGLAAEEIVARAYAGTGYCVAERRWRGRGGEIDLILTKGGQTIFVEVKKSRDIASAAARVTARQLQRISSSASAYLAGLPGGQDSDARIDVALVDGTGTVKILENVALH